MCSFFSCALSCALSVFICVVSRVSDRESRESRQLADFRAKICYLLRSVLQAPLRSMHLPFRVTVTFNNGFGVEMGGGRLDCGCFCMQTFAKLAEPRARNLYVR